MSRESDWVNDATVNFDAATQRFNALESVPVRTTRPGADDVELDENVVDPAYEHRGVVELASGRTRRLTRLALVGAASGLGLATGIWLVQRVVPLGISLALCLVVGGVLGTVFAHYLPAPPQPGRCTLCRRGEHVFHARITRRCTQRDCRCAVDTRRFTTEWLE